LQRYFVVKQAEAEDAENLSIERCVEGQLDEYKLTQQAVEKELQVLEDAAKTDKTGWYKRTGWLEFFQACNLAHVAHQLRVPGPSELRIKLAADLTERLVERSVRGLSTLPQEIC
jgi:hypothetical protein